MSAWIIPPLLHSVAVIYPRHTSHVVFRCWCWPGKRDQMTPAHVTDLNQSTFVLNCVMRSAQWLLYWQAPRCRLRKVVRSPRRRRSPVTTRKWRWLLTKVTTLYCGRIEVQSELVLRCFALYFCRYLKEFRTQQCAQFLQHKCTQHRPFTCFHWHFMNQRRRRPVRKRDGTFNYSPDVYCTKYDETTGICPDGDE